MHDRHAEPRPGLRLHSGATRVVRLCGAVLMLAGCYHPRTAVPGIGPVEDRPRSETIEALVDPTRVYLDMGLIAEGPPVPFVGGVSFIAGPEPDTTLALVSLSMPNSAFSFSREGDRYRATYAVLIDVREASTTVRHSESRQLVRVASFKETTRSEESIIFQQVLRLPPGQFVFSVVVRDEGSARGGHHEILVKVPRFAGGGLSSPVPVIEATARDRLDSLPNLVASPRATAVFGRDSLFRAYLEGYGSGTRLPLNLTVRTDKGEVLWRDTVALARHGTLFGGLLEIPVARLSVGAMTLTATRTDGADSTSAPLFVGFGDELPVSTFDQMLSYLRFYAAPERLKALRDTAPQFRAAAWASFLRETDPVLATPQHEGLREYFARIHQAIDRFHDDSGLPGWLTDRGMVYVTLGEPDQVFEQGASDINARGRSQVWQYQEHHLQLVFVDQTGFGRWRLTTTSEADFRAVQQRVIVH